jgi:MFS family permease
MLLLSGNFAVALGTNLVLPFLAIFLTEKQHLPAVAVAVAITARFWSQQGLTLAGGWISDRIGSVGSLRLGLAIRAVSYLAIAYVAQPVALVASCVLLGFGGALYVPASKATLAKLIGSADHLRTLFSLRSAANNAGNALGPPVGVALLVAGPRAAFFLTAAVFLVLAAALGVLRVPRAPGPAGAPGPGEPGPTRIPRRPLVWIATSSVAFGLCYIQLEYGLPVYAKASQGTAVVGVLFVVNAISVVLLQLTASQRAGAVRNPGVVVGGGLLLMAVGFGAAVLASAPALVVCVLMLSVGEVLIDPRLDSEVAAVIPAERRGIAFGVTGTCIAAGALVGNLLASVFLPHPMYWLILASTGAGLAVVVAATSPWAGLAYRPAHRLGRRRSRHRWPPPGPRRIVPPYAVQKPGQRR